MFEQFRIFLKVRATTSGVGDDGIIVSLEQRVDITAGQLASFFAPPGMDMKRATATLCGGDGNFAAVLAQHAHGGFVQPRKTDVRDTPAEEGHTMPLCALGAKDAAVVAEEERYFDFRREALD